MTDKTAREKIQARVDLRKEADAYRDIITDPKTSQEERDLAAQALLETENLLAGGKPGELPEHLVSDELAAEALLTFAKNRSAQMMAEANKQQADLDRDKAYWDKDYMDQLEPGARAARLEALDKRQKKIDALRKEAVEQPVVAKQNIDRANAQSQFYQDIVDRFEQDPSLETVNKAYAEG